MTRSLEALYARHGLDASAAIDPTSVPAQDLLAKNLDGALFREELARMADEMAQERRAAEQFATEARAWIAKLEGDVAALSRQLEAEVAERRRLGQEVVQLGIHKDAFDLLPGPLRKWLLKKILDARG
jgi:hypothetical protein